jgi:glucose-1-phosphate adenylyltransferase
VISPNVQVHEGATVDHSVILSHVTVGQNAVIHHAILDKHVVVPDGAQVGVDSEADEARGFYVSEGGITVVPKGVTVSAT